MLCECNCGLQVQVSGRRITRVRGDRAHPASRGYLCEKAQRIDHYQNGPQRLTQPLRRNPDGSFSPIDWETAIREVAQRLSEVRDTHGGASIFYYGGGGQGNHLPGAYARATRAALGSRYRSNALAQEKTGEFWVSGHMMGGMVRADFEHCEVAVFLGKNPWHSHGIPRARATLHAISKDPARTLIVIDPRRSETADLADIHLAVQPGTDAWLLQAMVKTLLDEDLLAHDWLEEHTAGLDTIRPLFDGVSVQRCARICGVDVQTIREVTRLIAHARSVSLFEDLGVQMNRHSTLVSWLERLVWLLTGHFAREGCGFVPTPLQAIGHHSKRDRRSPVAGARIISGMVPCNVIAEEILTDHPARYRAMIVEAANPAHSLADSPRVREALSALDCLVVIDVAMTETARLADYVLPTSTQYEKGEATFFNFEFPHNAFQFRRPILEPPEGVLPEAEIHARLVEVLGAMPHELVSTLRAALEQGRDAFAMAFFGAAADRNFQAIAPVVLYRVLGPTLPHPNAAVLYAVCHLFAFGSPESLARAGFESGDQLFDAILDSPQGVVFARDRWEDIWDRIPGGTIQLALPELFDPLAELKHDPQPDPDYPYTLSAGERRGTTANTIFRGHEWRRRDRDGALRIHPEDVAALDLGEHARVTTRRGSVIVAVEASDRMQRGHVSLPNGMGLTPDEGAETAGVAPNELTRSEDRDFLAGTPWHKAVPARIEAV